MDGFDLVALFRRRPISRERCFTYRGETCMRADLEITKRIFITEVSMGQFWQKGSLHNPALYGTFKMMGPSETSILGPVFHPEILPKINCYW